MPSILTRCHVVKPKQQDPTKLRWYTGTHSLKSCHTKFAERIARLEHVGTIQVCARAFCTLDNHPLGRIMAEGRRAPRPSFPRYLRSMGRPAQYLPTCAVPRAPRGQMRHLHILTAGGPAAGRNAAGELVDGLKPCPKYVKVMGVGDHHLKYR